MDIATNQFADDAYLILPDDSIVITSGAIDVGGAAESDMANSSTVIFSQGSNKTFLMEDDDILVGEVITESLPSEVVEVVPSNYVTLDHNLDHQPILDYNNVSSNSLISPGDVILVQNPEDVQKSEDVDLCLNEVSSVKDEMNLETNFVSDNEHSSDSYQDLVIDSTPKIEDQPDEELEVGFECSKCFFKVPNATALNRHYRLFHKKAPKKTKKPPSKTQKIKVQPEPNERRYDCPACTYSTMYRHEMDEHVQEHVLNGYHPNGKKRNCPNQPVQRQHHIAEEYHCEYCSYTCTVEEALIKHQKLHFTAKEFVLKVSCKICGKDRRSDLELKKHMRKHIDGQNFICDLCGFTSVQMKKIIQHRRMHTGERPHLCPFCNYRSARRDNLRSHVRRVHKKQNMYSDTFNPADVNDDDDHHSDLLHSAT